MTARVVIASTLWGRPALTRATLSQWGRLAWAVLHRGYEVVLALGVSTPDDRAIARQYTELVDIGSNAPLSRKWDRTIALARNAQPDALMIMGSDDWISPDAFCALAEAGLRSGYSGTTRLYIHDLPSCKTVLLDGYTGSRAVEPIGAGRVLRRDVLDALSWSLWPGHHVDRCLDAFAHKRVLGHDMTRRMRLSCAVAPEPILDVKSTTQLTPFERFHACPVVDTAILDTAIEAGTCERLAALALGSEAA